MDSSFDLDRLYRKLEDLGVVQPCYLTQAELLRAALSIRSNEVLEACISSLVLELRSLRDELANIAYELRG